METVTAATIQDMIATGRIVEAKTLLTMATTSLGAEELQACTLAIEQRQSQATTLIGRAEAMERAGKTEEARALYESILDVAVDFPGIREHLRRMDEALALTQAVQRRSRRVRKSLPPEKGGPKKRVPLVLGSSLAIGLVVAALFLARDKPHPPPARPEQTALAPVPHLAGPPASSPPAATPLPEPAPEDKTVVPEPTPATGPQPPAVADAAVSALPEPGVPLPAEQPTAPLQSAPPPEIPASTGGPQPVPEPAEPPAALYTVQPGDSLSLIAERRFCQNGLWQKIYQLNRDRITDPQKLQPGMVLRLHSIESRCPATP